jgi:hypothetical protein
VYKDKRESEINIAAATSLKGRINKDRNRNLMTHHWIVLREIIVEKSNFIFDHQ